MQAKFLEANARCFGECCYSACLVSDAICSVYLYHLQIKNYKELTTLLENASVPVDIKRDMAI